MTPEPHRRVGDTWYAKLGAFWDWIDKRQIDAHVVAAIILYGTIKITHWAMHFASDSPRPGLEIAAIIGAVMVPWSALQGAVVSFYFKTRENDYTVKS